MELARRKFESYFNHKVEREGEGGMEGGREFGKERGKGQMDGQTDGHTEGRRETRVGKISLCDALDTSFRLRT